MKMLPAIAIVLIMLLPIQAALSQDDTPSDIVDTAIAAGSFNTLVAAVQAAGLEDTLRNAAYWDGMTESGEQAASGLYFYTMRAGRFVSTRKMIVLK
jgi:hypothetical protein